MTVPFGAHPTLASIKNAVRGKVLVDVTVPLVPPRVARVQLPPEGSAGMIAQTLLGEEVQVVSALQNVAAAHEPIWIFPAMCWSPATKRLRARV